MMQDTRATNRPISPASDSHRRRDFTLAVLIFCIAVLVRLPLLRQSCWCDELATLQSFVYVPVKQIVAGGPGIKYYPNNHILHSLLAKVSLASAKALRLLPRPRPTDNPPPAHPIGSGSGSFSETALRMPAMLAGSLLGIVLAWPLRRSRPLAAMTIALILAVQPWLISFSTEARGYTIVLLLIALATHLLPRKPRRMAWGYTITITLALYTIPICITVIAAHGVTMLLLRRTLFPTWLRSALVAGLLTALLYSPLFHAMRAYYREDNDPTIAYPQFLHQLPGYLLAGHRTNDPLSFLLPPIILLGGGYLAWKQNLLRPAFLTFAIAGLIGLFAPLLSHAAGEVRFVPWLILLYVICLTAIITALWTTPRLRLAACALMAIFFLHATLQYRSFYQTPAQPIRDGLDLIGKIAPPDAPVVLLNMGAQEAAYGYADIPRQSVQCAYRIPDLQQKEQASSGPVWVVVLYADLIQRDEPEVLEYVHAHYTRRLTLSGRISPIDIYAQTARQPP